MPKTTIAKFSFWKTVPLVVVGTGALIPAYYYPFASGDPLGFFRSEPVGGVIIILVWVGSYFVLPIYWHLFFQLAFARGTGLWMEAGKIVYMNKRFLIIPADDVRSMSLTSFKNWGRDVPIIEVMLKSGGSKSIPTGMLREPSEIVLGKLEEILKAQAAWRSPGET